MEIRGFRQLLQIKGFILLSFFFFYSHSLKCYDCTTLQGIQSFERDCAQKVKPAGLKDGYAGCIKIEGLTDNGQDFVIRSGHTNAQVAGRVPSCYHPEQELQFTPHVSAITFDTIMNCYACDDQDGCNGGASAMFLWCTDQKYLFFLLLLIILALNFV